MPNCFLALYLGKFQKISWTEKEKLWTWEKKSGSPEEKMRYKGSLRHMKKIYLWNFSPCVKIKQAFLCCYECSDFSLAGQLSGLECGEFLLILTLLWPHGTVSTTRETVPFRFHKADLARLPPSVQGVGGPQSSWESLGWQRKNDYKDTLKNPTHLSSQQESQSLLPLGVQAYLCYHACHQSRRNRRHCVEIKNNLQPWVLLMKSDCTRRTIFSLLFINHLPSC